MNVFYNRANAIVRDSKCYSVAVADSLGRPGVFDITL